MGRSRPHLIHGSLGGAHPSTPQTACRSVSRSSRAAEHGQLNRIRQIAPMCTPRNTYFLGSTRVHNPNSISFGSASFAQLTAECRGAKLRVVGQKTRLRTADLDSHLIHGSLGLPVSTTQTASRSVQPFLHRSPHSVVRHAGHASCPKNCAYAWGDLEAHPMHGSLGPNGISIGSAVLDISPHKCPCTLQCATTSPLKIAPSNGVI